MARVSCAIVVFLCNVVGFLGVRADIIQLRNETFIHCIDEDSSSILFTSPPIQGIIPSIENQNHIDWNEDDWTNGNANDFPLSSITDKRWEDFEIKHNNSIQFTVKESTSFSVYGAQKLIFFLYDSEEMDYFQFSSNSGEEWIHFTALLKNNNAYILKNNEIIHISYIFHPNKWTISSEEEVYWKIHDRKLKWSNTVSSTPSFVTIPPTNHSFLLMYISLCPHCTLEIVSPHGTKRISNLHTNNLTNDWQTQQISLDAEIETTITIDRKSNTDSTDGYWMVDFLLRNLTNTISYKLPPEEVGSYACQKLNNTSSFNTNHERKKRSTEGSNSCDAGKLGQNCEIDCANILGKKFNYCNEHHICDHFGCKCSWGYEGTNCHDVCKEGRWGFDCNKLCPTECKNKCDVFTGKCTESSIAMFAVIAVVVVIAVGSAIATITYHTYFGKKMFQTASDAEAEGPLTVPESQYNATGNESTNYCNDRENNETMDNWVRVDNEQNTLKINGKKRNRQTSNMLLPNGIYDSEHLSHPEGNLIIINDLGSKRSQ